MTILLIIICVASLALFNLRKRYVKNKHIKSLTEFDIIETKYKVGKLIATISDVDDVTTYTITFIGRVDILYNNHYNSKFLDKKLKHFDHINIIYAKDIFNKYLIDNYGRSNLFEMDNDILIPSHKIKNISFTYDENFEVDFFYYKN